MGLMPTVGLYGVLEKSEQGWEQAEATVAEVGRQLEAAGLQRQCRTRARRRRSIGGQGGALFPGSRSGPAARGGDHLEL